MLLVACGDPMATMPRLSDADIPEDTTTLSAIPDGQRETAEGTGFFSRLFGGYVNDERSEDTKTPPAAVEEPAPADKEFPPETYGVTAELPESPGKPGGILAALFAPDRNDDTAPRIAPGNSQNIRLPYGRIASVCELSERSMGKKVAQYPERRPRHKLYDSDPGNTVPHTFYLTGFADGCARQFTASLAVFGSVGMHEQLRYGLPAEVQPYSDTDRAYEKVKARVCGVPRRKPCGNKLGRLENDTVFLSIYENFGDNQRWSNLLLHGGKLMAQDIKG